MGLGRSKLKVLALGLFGLSTYLWFVRFSTKNEDISHSGSYEHSVQQQHSIFRSDQNKQQNTDTNSIQVPVNPNNIDNMETNLAQVPLDHKQQNVETSSIQVPSNKPKTILYYTKFYAQENWPFGLGQESFLKYNCRVTNCVLTRNFSMMPLRDFDALIFNFFHGNFVIRENGNFVGFNLPDPKDRSPHQRYIMYMLDPVVHAMNDPEVTPERINGIFNWTLTYRADSDLYQPYGWLTRKTPGYQSHPNPTTIGLHETPWLRYQKEKVAEWIKDNEAELMPYAKRPREVAWIVSHCTTMSQRELYAKELKKYVDVEILGNCGDKCGKGTNNCTDYVMANFKYYLAFENSLCDYYVTEKFWKAMQRYVVPIVMGRARYSTIAPPHSFLNVDDYQSPKALAEDIQRISSDPHEYLSYFWWKTEYRVTSGPDYWFATWCDLCAKLNDPTEPVKVFNGLEEISHCDKPDWFSNSQ